MASVRFSLVLLVLSFGLTVSGRQGLPRAPADDAQGAKNRGRKVVRGGT